VKPLRFGIVGTGQMAANFAAELGALEGAGLVAAGVASRRRAAAEGFATKHGIDRAFDSYEELAADPDIDVAYIATPHVYHEAHTLLCLRAGKHVLCEKPLAINAAQADRMIECARANGRFLMEALWTRFLPAFRAAREYVAGGALGRISLITGGGAFVPSGNGDQYLLNRSLGGGVLLDAGVYYVSLVEDLLGPALRVQASGIIGSHGVDEQDQWLSEHADGAQAGCYVSLRTRRPPELEILGDRGRLLLHAPVFCPSRLTLIRPGEADERQDYPIEGSGYRYQALEVVRCVQAGLLESPVMPLAASRAVMAAMDQIRAQIGMRYPGE
jgi:predicted dehydrogenase